MNNELDAYWDFLVDNNIATKEELGLVTNLNGYSKETLDDVLYCRTGYRSLDQYKELEGVEDEYESIDIVNNITDRIIEGEDIGNVLGLTCAATTLMDRGITSTDDVDELYLYIVNDGDLYRGRTRSIIDNLRKKYTKGAYDNEKAVKAFMYLVDDGVRKYDKEFVSKQGKLFLDKKTREEIAKKLLARYEEEIMGS